MSAQALKSPSGILVRDLVKKYHDRPVLNHLDITIETGALCILVGANGAGKTTLLRILAGLVRPDSGKIQVGAPAGSNELALRRQIGYVGHQTMFYQDLSAVENLRHYAQLYQVPQADARISSAIHSAGIEHYQHQALRAYSRGMGQRLAIARALLHDPEILLFDEPYTGLDNEAAHALDKKLFELHGRDKTIFLAAHQPHRLLSIATHIAWLKDGCILHHVPISALPQTPNLEAYLQESA